MVRISAASAKSARRFNHGLALIAATAMTAATAPVHAQSWPTKQPIKLVAVFPPAAPVDQVARIPAQPLQSAARAERSLWRTRGASGSIGAAFVAQAPADGYTFAVVFDSHAVNPALIPSLPFDTKRTLLPFL